LRLAIFDIDGTLTQTNHVDTECFLVAMARALDLPTGHVDWTDAPHVTDAGILEWLFDRHWNRAPTSDEVLAAKTELLSLLKRELAADPSRFDPVPGAREIFGRLTGAGWTLAMATGCWGVSAQLKLTAAKIHHAGMPLICSDDAPMRTTLLSRAIDQAADRCAAPFERIVSVGDALWDVAAAVGLGIPFVGIAVGEQAARLREAGATNVLPDLSDPLALGRALEQAGVPQRGIT